MKKSVILLSILCLSLSVLAYEYQPKNVNSDPFAKVNKNINAVSKSAETSVGQKPEMREIKNLTEYFRYLPKQVHRNWTPYKANSDYEVAVQFRIHNDGSVTDIEVVKSTNPKANASVINAVKTASPFQPLPKSYPSDSVKAEVVLQYQK